MNDNTAPVPTMNPPKKFEVYADVRVGNMIHDRLIAYNLNSRAEAMTVLVASVKAGNINNRIVER